MSEQRKKDHLDLTFKSRPESHTDLGELFYEPLFSGHPSTDQDISKKFIGQNFEIPLWVSSMTGGTQKAKSININLAKACKDFGMGMGLGSCRSLIDSDSRFEDFNIKGLMGTAPLYTNFGIAQLEQLLDSGKHNRVNEITKSLNADGVIIHVNPLQEWSQAEGDNYQRPAIDTIKAILGHSDYPVIVKEVGQGFGPKSLEALTSLPLSAIELAGFGGTNFTILEQARLTGANEGKRADQNYFGPIGHTCDEMIAWLNDMDPKQLKCNQFIISGGIKDPLAGHVLMNKLKFNSVFGMASTLLSYSMEDYEVLYKYMSNVREHLLMANSFLRG